MKHIAFPISLLPIYGTDFKKVVTFAFFEFEPNVFTYTVTLNAEGICNPSAMKNFIETWAITNGRQLK